MKMSPVLKVGIAHSYLTVTYYLRSSQALREADLEELTVQVDIFEEAMSDDYENMLDRYGAETLLKVCLQTPVEHIKPYHSEQLLWPFLIRNWTSTRWSWASVRII